ncbi:hypothetical protein [Actinophytocola xanthii]|uniref:Uncharacterized protein n=1 Tax=Actinophytocola xanthii TaxID=1912961 RepID=A0A1Q8CM65_9PSEU|nr:hypothetical protein [Actinophytocola xanthii]OLF15458.1 hypothetical protein BU204_21235 [Actinophytocola xanthii]
MRETGDVRESITRVVPRVLLGGVLLLGFACLVTGIGQRGDVRNAYEVGFGQSGDRCEASVDVHLDVETGEAMSCTNLNTSFGAPFAFSGFTAGQNEEVAALVERLGDGGLSEGEQRRIQDRVDELAATVPAENRPYHYSGLWGTGLALLGGGIIVAGLVLFLLLRRRLESLLGRLPWPR